MLLSQIKRVKCENCVFCFFRQIKLHLILIKWIKSWVIFVKLKWDEIISVNVLKHVWINYHIGSFGLADGGREEGPLIKGKQVIRDSFAC